MQLYNIVLALVLSTAVEGFAPQTQARVGTEIRGSLFDAIAEMDLFAPKKDQNTYGARNNKNLKVGEIQAGKSYVPAGLNAKQYADLRSAEKKKKDDNYKRNVAKAGVFEDYTEFYIKRGTDLSQAWKKDKNTLGHRMAKTKFDWSGKDGKANKTTAAVGTQKKKGFFGKKK